MRKVYLAIILLCSFPVLYSQVKFTPEVGVGILKDRQDGGNATVSPRVGIGMDYFFSHKECGWGITSGLYYYYKKSNSSITMATFQNERGEWQYIPFVDYTQGSLIPDAGMVQKQVLTYGFDTRRDFLQLPIMAKYKWKINETYALSVAAGGYVAVGVGGKHHIHEYDYDLETSNIEYTKTEINPYDVIRYNRFDAGFSSRFTFQMEKFVFNVNYEVNLYRRNDVGYENLISVSAGYTF